MDISEKRLIKEFPDGVCLFFGRGKFDEFCVFEVESLDRDSAFSLSQAPSDVKYFEDLVLLGRVFGNVFCWNAFVMLYDVVSKDFSEDVCAKITALAENFPGYELFADKLFTTLYAAMVAEENKAFSVLGKSIKALGVHQILLEGVPVRDAANFSKGMKAYQLRELMSARGIGRDFAEGL